MSVGHIAKTDIIRHYGQKIANQIYADGRKVDALEIHVIDVPKSTIQSLVNRNGYTRPEDVQRLVLHRLREETVEDEETYSSYRRIVGKYMNRKNDMCSMAGFVFRQQTKEDHERFGTTENFWIITAANGNEAGE